MPTVALVDDDRNILTSVSIALEAEGYRIMTYTDGASALEGFKTSPPDLAILDIKMPRMDGMELLRRLRQKTGTVQGRRCPWRDAACVGWVRLNFVIGRRWPMPAYRKACASLCGAAFRGGTVPAE